MVALVAVVATPANEAKAAGKYAGYVIDMNSGKVLYESDANAKRYPASLTKMMTLYMLFEQMRAGKVRESTPIRISSHAAGMSPSKLGLKAGSTISAKDAAMALITKSANDIAAAVGEHIGGSESRFAELMTQKARQLGMRSTTFRNASGLPNSSQVTTAKDMAILGIALQEHFPREFKWFSAKSFTYRGKRMGNHNRLLGNVQGVDGIKTGYTRASGFNLVSSVNTGGRSIVAVVMGGKSGASRDAQMRKLIAAYLPKASKRDRGPLVAKASPLAITPAGSKSAANMIAALPAHELPVPSMERPEELVPPEEIVAAYAPEPAPQEAVDAITTATANSRTGWVIQLAALGSQEEALAYLQKAQDKAGKVLGKRDPFVEMFEKSGTTYHRARFAGFNSKDDAWNTCQALKKYKYSCLAYER